MLKGFLQAVKAVSSPLTQPEEQADDQQGSGGRHGQGREQPGADGLDLGLL